MIARITCGLVNQRRNLRPLAWILWKVGKGVIVALVIGRLLIRLGVSLARTVRLFQSFPQLVQRIQVCGNFFLVLIRDF